MKDDISTIKSLLQSLKKENKILIAILYGSYAKGLQHRRSDIDLALYIKAKNQQEELKILDTIHTSSEKEIAILRLHDEDESPFVIQEALKGIHLVPPDKELFYALSDRILHECENIRFNRRLTVG